MVKCLHEIVTIGHFERVTIAHFIHVQGWFYFVLNRHYRLLYDDLETRPTQFKKRPMYLVLIAHIVEVKRHSKIMMIGHCTASIIAHYHISNMAAIFSDCTL